MGEIGGIAQWSRDQRRKKAIRDWLVSLLPGSGACLQLLVERHAPAGIYIAKTECRDGYTMTGSTPVCSRP